MSALLLQAGVPEIFTIVGQSGSGKTTLARMILGMETPTSGSIRLLGQDLAHIRGAGSRKLFMGAVQPIFQNPFEAFNPLRQLDHYLFLTARRFGDASDQQRARTSTDAALRQVGLSLSEVAGRYPHELSGGQLQRAAIARALLAKPKLIVADEPVSMVDASLRMSIVNLFKTLRDELGISIIYITHDLATAYYISDRIMIMKDGKWSKAATPGPCLQRRSTPIRGSSRTRFSCRAQVAVTTPRTEQNRVQLDGEIRT